MSRKPLIEDTDWTQEPVTVPESDATYEPEPEPAKRLVCAVCELPAGTCFHPVNHVKEV